MVKDDFIEYQVEKFKQLKAKYNAVAQKSKFLTIIEEFNHLKKIGAEKLKEYFSPQESLQLQPLFRKFEELTETDEKSILQDQEFLLFIKKLKEKIVNDDNISNS